MKINKILDPFSYILIDNFLDEESYKEVFTEIISLIPNLRSPAETGSSRDNNRYRKRGLGIFIDDIFQDNRNNSSILTNYEKKLSSVDIVKEMLNHDWFFKTYYFSTNRDTTLLQSYGDGDFYNAHTDASNVTLIGLYHKKPKAYSGGELIFPTYDIKFDLVDNQVLLFPSQIPHQVLEITKNDDDEETNRFTITKFFNII
jgi:Rps23 Pro-64 3,4-dihydroxylase Tpa1-like proline 4-hydroxylase